MRYLIFIAVVGTIWLLAFWLTRKGRAEYEANARSLGEIRSIPFEQAEMRALALLEDSRLFRCTEAPPQVDDQLKTFAEGIQRLFRRFERIESISGPNIRLDRNLIGVSCAQPNLISIGRGMEGTDVEFEIGVAPGKETIYEIYPSEVPDPMFGTYESIFHFLIAVASE